jgi:peptidoglycan hydrolase-like protein with peptidoglycan-binding domain
MKRKIVYFVVALLVMGSARADQTVQSVQQALKDQGFYYGNVTGDKSSETTAAVRRYQIRNGLQVTGEMDPQTLHSLNIKSNSAASSQPTSKPAVAQQNTNTVRPVETPRLDQNSVQQPPNAPDHHPEMNPTFPGALYQPAPTRMNRRMVSAEVQRQLISRGYYQGRVDGRHGRRTALALRAFQFGSGLPPTGHLDASTLNALGLSEDANLAYSEPAPRHYETWAPVMKLKHGKWKMKWKKYHREDRDGLADEARSENGDEQGHGPDGD